MGAELVAELCAVGVAVRATTRHLTGSKLHASVDGVEWVRCDLARPEDVEIALNGVSAAYYLVHSIGTGPDYVTREVRHALCFREAAARAGVGRIIYLGAVAPSVGPRQVSPHLASRLAVGQVLRGGAVPALELRASMIVGQRSASFRLLRDVGLRLPVIALPDWTRCKMSPIAIEDVVVALVAALDMPLAQGEWLDLPGCDVLTIAEMVAIIPKLRRRHVPLLDLPRVQQGLAARGLSFISAVPRELIRELIQGLGADLLPAGESFWERTGLFPQVPFQAAVVKTLASELLDRSPRGIAAFLAEISVHALGRVWQSRAGR